MKPDIASRYPNRLTSELLSVVYNSKNSEEAYYVSCFSLYRLKLLISNKKIDPKYSKLRWHILSMAANYCSETCNATGYKSKFTAMYALFSESEGKKFDELERLIKTGIPNPDISRDVLKSPPLLAETLQNTAPLVAAIKGQG